MKDVKKKGKPKKTKSKTGQSGKKKKTSSVCSVFFLSFSSSAIRLLTMRTSESRSLSSVAQSCLDYVHASPQSDEDFLEESDFDDISLHSASVFSDTLGAATKKKARRGRKKRKSMFTSYTQQCRLGVVVFFLFLSRISKTV